MSCCTVVSKIYKIGFYYYKWFIGGFKIFAIVLTHDHPPSWAQFFCGHDEINLDLVVLCRRAQWPSTPMRVQFVPMPRAMKHYIPSLDSIQKYSECRRNIKTKALFVSNKSNNEKRRTNIWHPKINIVSHECMNALAVLCDVGSHLLWCKSLIWQVTCWHGFEYSQHANHFVSSLSFKLPVY